MHTVVINAETIALSSSFTSKPISVPADHNHFALEWVITGNGTGKFEYEASADGKVYVLDNATPIKTGQTKTSGPGGDGIDMKEFAPRACEAIKIKCSETAGANNIAVTATLITT